jgi:hypothetical protein
MQIVVQFFTLLTVEDPVVDMAHLPGQKEGSGGLSPMVGVASTLYSSKVPRVGIFAQPEIACQTCPIAARFDALAST